MHQTLLSDLLLAKPLAKSLCQEQIMNDSLHSADHICRHLHVYMVPHSTAHNYKKYSHARLLANLLGRSSSMLADTKLKN